MAREIINDTVLDSNNMILNITADTKEEVLNLMGSNLFENGYVKESFNKAILDREKFFPTGLMTTAINVAIPHTDSEHVFEETISIGILKDPVKFIMMGTEEETVDVNIVFMLAIKNPEKQLEMLQKLIEIFQNENLLFELYSKESELDIYNFFKRILKEK